MEQNPSPDNQGPRPRNQDSGTILIDTHCHLDFPQFDSDRKEVIRRSLDAGVRYLVNIGSSLENSRKSLELSQEYGPIFCSIGFHPHEADSFDKGVYDSLDKMCACRKVAAIGEIGLDYYKNFSKPQNQRKVFRQMLALAREKKLPVVLHCRQAQDDLLEIIKEYMPLKAVVHCFSGDSVFLKDCLEMGFFVSFTCNITYKKADVLREAARLAPLERIMLETDAPFLSPEGMRGERNEPMQVKRLAEELALVKGLDFGRIASVTSDNAVKFFGLDTVK